MGARVALEVFAKAPERVTRLALFDTGVHPPLEGERDKRQLLIDLGQQQGMRALVNAWLPPMVHPDRHEDAALMQPLFEMAIKPGVAGFSRQVRALLTRRDAMPLLQKVKCPVLVAVGEQDLWSPPVQHAQMIDNLTTAAGTLYHVYPDTGHMAPIESPEAVNASLEAWLAMPANTAKVAKSGGQGDHSRARPKQ